MRNSRKVIVITGPTSSGKTSLAIALARRFKGEIVSADSRQVYRGLDIGSGKADRQERGSAIHHLLDVASPRKQFSVTQFQNLAKRAVNDIFQRGRLPVICGGTGHYIDALIYDEAFPDVKPDRRLRKILGKMDVEKLYEKLKKLDPSRAKTIDRRNPRRLIRALEIVLTTKRPVPTSKPPTPLYDALWIGLNPPREVLKRKIRNRLLARIKKGMVAEVRRLRSEGLSWKRLESFGLDYMFVSRYLEGEFGKSEMIERIWQAECEYSKRQMTWFRRNPKINWVKNRATAEQLVKKWLA